jgi:hypothetical protein
MSGTQGLAPLLRRAARALAEVDPVLAEELTQAALREAGTKGLSVKAFLEIVIPGVPTLSLPPEAIRKSKGWNAKIGAMLKRSGLTEELTQDLARAVASWSTQPMPIETLITRSAQYLSQPVKAGPAKTSLGPRPMSFGDRDADESDE